MWARVFVNKIAGPQALQSHRVMKRHHFERAVLAALERGGEERFAIPAFAHHGLRRALEMDLDSAAPLDALDAGLRLAAAFDGRMQSPSIAMVIRSLMHDNARAIQLLLERRRETSPIDQARAHARREDRVVTALPFTSDAPAGSRPLRAWLNTGKTEMRGRRSWQLKA